MLQNFYFTFGSDPLYPYGAKDSVLVRAESLTEALEKYKARHPNRPGSSAINCAFWYSEEELARFRDRYYKGVEPAEIIE